MGFFDEARDPATSGAVDRLVRRFPNTACAISVAALYALVLVAVALALTRPIPDAEWEAYKALVRG